MLFGDDVQHQFMDDSIRALQLNSLFYRQTHSLEYIAESFLQKTEIPPYADQFVARIDFGLDILWRCIRCGGGKSRSADGILLGKRAGNEKAREKLFDMFSNLQV